MSDPILEVKNLVKNYGSFKAVDDISFIVPRGKVIGLLGPNGAGKTTTIQVLLGITLLNGGTIKYFGEDFYKNKQYCLQRINFASAFNTLQGRISVRENLLVFAYLYAVKKPEKKITELAEYFEITDLLPQRYWDLSSGQKTRVNIIKSLLNDPQMILMDEPTASLDPDIADKTLSLIEKLRESHELSILFTSHNMEEVTRICDEVIFLDHGKIVAQDTPLGLTKRIPFAKLRIVFDGQKDKIEEYLKSAKQNFEVLNKNTVLINTEEKLIPKMIFGLSNTGIWITDIEVKKPTLEDVFLEIARGK
jgi:ABC-2 type transport system ATP-binding protein